MDRRYVYLAWCAIHFFIIVAASSRDTLWALAQGYSFLPDSLEQICRNGENVASAALGERLDADNPVRQGIAAYAHSAGIESGYGFFAPNVPDSYKVVFELRYPDGRIERELPPVGGAAAGLRLAALLHQIGQTHSERLRDAVIKTLADAMWKQHPDATSMRAVFGYVKLPTASEFARGRRESYQFLDAYDFSLHSRSTESQP